jgi:type IV/VI secretion system ImpK/VasF family protein
MTKSTNYEYPRAVIKTCAEVVVIVTGIPKQSSAVNMEDLYGRVCAKFDSVIKQCKVNSLPGDAALELIYPLAALVDETILSIPQCRFFWSERPLQLRYFREVAAGTTFFSRLESRMKAKNPQTDVLELYFIGLALGLKGMHTAHDPRQCVRIFENLGIMLKNIRRRKRNARTAVPVNREKRPAVSKRAVLAAYPAIVIIVMISVAVVYRAACNDLLKFLVHF